MMEPCGYSIVWPDNLEVPGGRRSVKSLEA